MAGDPLRLILRDFRGIDLFHAPDALPPGYMRAATNLLCDRGTLRTRGGTSKYNSSALGAPIRGLHRLYLKSGTKQMLVVCGTDLYHATSGAFSAAGFPAATPTDPLSGDSDFSFATLNDKAFFGDGTDYVRTWNGTTGVKLSAITPPAAAPTVTKALAVVNACDALTNWSTDGGADLVLSQETALQFEGAGCLKAVASTSSKGKQIKLDLGSGARLDLSGCRHVGFWIRADRTGTYLQFGLGEAGGNENTWPIRIRQANAWQYVTIDVNDLPDDSKDAARYFTVRVLDDTTGFTMYVDRIESSGGLAGSYEYRYTYYNSTSGVESSPSDSKVIDVTGPRYEAANITVVASAEADKVRIYRKGGYSPVWRLVSEQLDTVGTYTDKYADYQLGAEQDPWRGVPPKAKYLVAFGGRIVYAGVTTAPSTLYLSNFNEPEVVPTLTLLETNQGAGGTLNIGDDGDIITGLAAVGEVLYVFKRGSVWRLAGTGFRDFMDRPLTTEFGCAAPKSIAVADDGVIWYTGDRIIALQGGVPQAISDPVRARLDTIIAANRDVCCGIINDLKYWFFYSTSASAATFNNAGLVYDLRTQSWTELTGWNVRCLIETRRPGDAEALYYGDGVLGTLWLANNGTTDNSAAIAWEAKTGEQEFDAAQMMKALRRYRLFCANAGGERLTAEALADEGRQKGVAEHPLTNLEGTPQVASQTIIEGWPPHYVQGRRLALKLSGNATVAVELQGIELEADVVGPV